MPTETNEPWVEYRRLILAELERLNVGVQGLTTQIVEVRVTDLAEIRSEIGMLKVKAGVWGIVGGVLPVIILVLLSFLKLR